MQLENKVAFITGARRGIGRAIALKYAQNGADCVLLARSAPDELAEEIRSLGRRAVALACDVSDNDQVEAAVKQSMGEFGKIDVLVNNAGIAQDGLLIRMKLEQWQNVIDVNLSGAFYCTKAVARHMLKANAGRIINVSSVIGQMGNAGQANYAASKAGLIGFTKSIAKELGSRGITCNAIAPGFITTDMTSDMSEEAKTLLLQNVPLGTLGEPEDVAELALFLAGTGARYITGQVLNVDGGLVM
ncbi:MAG TPA: 3-oxoacyl-[acyl-carrier-protein] reductase [Abditibacteriaceae bacterium]|jgi:3-oxoacyl-[acyl-carrier protein] reductase